MIRHIMTCHSMTWYGMRMARDGSAQSSLTALSGAQVHNPHPNPNPNPSPNPNPNPKLTALSGAQVHKEGVWAMRHAIDPQVRDHHAQFGGVALRERVG